MKTIVPLFIVMFALIGCQTTKHISTDICDRVERIHSINLAYNLGANLGDKEYSADIVKPFLGVPQREKEMDGNSYYFYQESKDCEVSIEVKDGVMNYFEVTGDDCYETANYVTTNYGPWSWTTVLKGTGGFPADYWVEGCLYFRDE